MAEQSERPAEATFRREPLNTERSFHFCPRVYMSKEKSIVCMPGRESRRCRDVPEEQTGT